MEKTNWIEKIKEAVRVAMNKGLNVKGDHMELLYSFIIESEFKFFIYLDINNISIYTKKGHVLEKYSITERDDLELRTLILSIKEYNENMAIMELNNFFEDGDDKPKSIDNLDDDD